MLLVNFGVISFVYGFSVHNLDSTSREYLIVYNHEDSTFQQCSHVLHHWRILVIFHFLFFVDFAIHRFNLCRLGISHTLSLVVMIIGILKANTNSLFESAKLNLLFKAFERRDWELWNHSCALSLFHQVLLVHEHVTEHFLLFEGLFRWRSLMKEFDIQV